MRVISTILLSLLALQLAGCKHAPKVPPRDPIKIVGVVSLLPTELSYQKVGITVFNNEKTTRPVGEALNIAARAGAESAIKIGDRTVVQVSVDAPALARSMQNFPGTLDNKFDQISDDLQAMIAKDKLDAVVVVVETYDRDKGVNGVRVLVRAGMGYITKVEVMPHIAVIAVDKNLKRLGLQQVTESYAITRPEDQKWTYTLAENLDTATQEKVNKIMKNALESGVELAVGSISF
jgi:hypothetical protein